MTQDQVQALIEAMHSLQLELATRLTRIETKLSEFDQTKREVETLQGQVNKLWIAIVLVSALAIKNGWASLVGILP